jgi:hypothetical protein
LIDREQPADRSLENRLTVATGHYPGTRAQLYLVLDQRLALMPSAIMRIWWNVALRRGRPVEGDILTTDYQTLHVIIPRPLRAASEAPQRRR